MRRGTCIWIILLAALALTATAGAQTGDYIVTLNRTYGGPEAGEAAYAIVPDPGGDGFFLAGETESFGAGKTDAWVVRLNPEGIAEWNRTYGGEEDDTARSFVRTSDGGLLVAGSLTSVTNGTRPETDAWLVKINTTGDEVWNRTYGGPDVNASANAVTPAGDGGYLFVGSTTARGGNESDAWAVRVNETGGEVWSRMLGGAGNDTANAVVRLPDGDFVLAGSTASSGAGMDDVWVVRLNESGSEVWNRTFGSPDDDAGRAVANTPDGGLIVAGTFTERPDNATVDTDALLIKLTPAGDLIWNWIYGEFGVNESAAAVIAADGGGYVFAGETGFTGTDDTDAWVVGTDPAGAVVWSRTAGGVNPGDRAASLIEAAPGEYTVAGTFNATGQEGPVNTDAWLIRLAIPPEPTPTPTTAPTATPTPTPTATPIKPPKAPEVPQKTPAIVGQVPVPTEEATIPAAPTVPAPTQAVMPGDGGDDDDDFDDDRDDDNGFDDGDFDDDDDFDDDRDDDNGFDDNGDDNNGDDNNGFDDNGDDDNGDDDNGDDDNGDDDNGDDNGDDNARANDNGNDGDDDEEDDNDNNGVRDALSGMVWYDIDADGAPGPGEPGIPGISVRLIGERTMLDAAVTGPDGVYRFAAIPTGRYSGAEFLLPDGYSCTVPGLGSDAALLDGPVAFAEGGAGQQTLNAGLVGDYRAETPADAYGWVLGTVWGDGNQDGINDETYGMTDVEVRLLDAEGEMLASARTGYHDRYTSLYLFGPLLPGEYAVAFTPPDGYTFTTADGDSSADPTTGSTGPFTVAGGDVVTRDAGLIVAPIPTPPAGEAGGAGDEGGPANESAGDGGDTRDPPPPVPEGDLPPLA